MEKNPLLKEHDFLDFLQSFNQKYFFLVNFHFLSFFIQKAFNKVFSPLNIKPEEGSKKEKLESRYNFASILGGAKILEKNPECLYDKSVLDDNPDK